LLEFHVLETDIGIQIAVSNEVKLLEKEFPNWKFTSKFGK